MRALIVSLESFQKGDVPEEVKQFIEKNPNPFIILDESSKIKTNNPCKEKAKSKRTQAVLKLNTTGQRCILTGTFMSKTPVNAYDQMNFLKAGFFPESMYAFAEHYEVRRNLPSHRGARVLVSQKDWVTLHNKLKKNSQSPERLTSAMDSIYGYYGISREVCSHILEHEEYTPFRNLDELWQRIGDTVYRVDRHDVFDLPEKVYRTYGVGLTKEQKKLYMELQNLNCTDNITVDNGLSLYLRFQDICNGYEPVEKGTEEDKEYELVPLKANPKIEMLCEIAEELENEQAVIWCSRSKLLHDACAELEKAGYKCGIYDGKTARKEREESYQAFSERKIQFLFANPVSAGYGLNGLKGADYAVYLCCDYSVEARVQSEFRTDRGASDRTKYVFDIVCKGTCEDRVVQGLKMGKELLSSGKTSSSIFTLEEK